jgi:PleD family two-component response regulator
MTLKPEMDKKTILLIDDSNTNLVLLETLLKRNGYNVCSALNAMDGIGSIKKNIPDLIYLDLVMPDLDGLDFMKILRSKPEWEKIPVIILSAVSDRSLINKSKEMGVADYIVKPININKIIDLTKNYVNN